jgi:hypothetical protein
MVHPAALPPAPASRYRSAMARKAKLKVFRMPVGFHDAYIAAPSQKAAAEAWGADADIFRRGQADIVTDPELTREPLAHAGKVIKRLRGTEAEQIAALGKSEERPKPREPDARPKATPKPKPRPSRGALEKAEQALAEAEARHREEDAALKEREATLARERQAMEKKQDRERERLEERRAKAEAAYDEAMRRWRKS